MPVGGDFCFVFSTRGPKVCTESCPGVGILMEKISGPGAGDGNRSN